MRRVIERYCPTVQVKLIIGITDIDDKIIRRATQEGMTPIQVARRYEAQFVDSLARLGVKFPERFLRVSDYISEIIHFVKTIQERGMAYRGSDGSIYFSVKKYMEFGMQYPKFRPLGSLAVVGGTIKEDQRDFALWKAVKPGEPFWSSPWGDGRPGWHIECSALIESVFGGQIDLHSGGMDLEFPHHENEIAQSEAFHKRSPWCPFFLHTGLLTIRGTKMSKSLGNFISVAEMLEKYTSEDFRMFCLMSSYRSPMDFSWDKLHTAASKYNKIRRFIRQVEKLAANHSARRVQKMDFVDSQLLLGYQDQNTCFLSYHMLFRVEHSHREICSALTNDFDWVSALHNCEDLMRDTHKYLYQKGSQSHPLVLNQVVEEIKTFMIQMNLLIPLTWIDPK